MPSDPSSPTRSEILAAFAARADTRLTSSELQRLEEYVVDVWEMADRLRRVPTPGLGEDAGWLPRRAAYANRPDGATAPSAAVDSAPPPEASAARAETEAEAIAEAGLVQGAAAMARGEASPATLVEVILRRIASHDGVLRSYISVDAEGARAVAQALGEEAAERGPRSLLHGMPVGAKDNIPAAGMPCTFNSRLTREWWPKRDAECIRRLRAAGAVLVGKHNLNEFGWSIPSEDDLYPPPRNPWLPEEYSVGSSSGGGASVAARLAVAALGTDGGGSTRLPAAQHGLFGLKPGHRRVPNAGVTEGRISEVGVLARHAEDVAAVFAALTIDPDASDAGARFRSDTVAAAERVTKAPEALRIAVPDGYVGEIGMEDDVAEAFEATLGAAGDLGHELVRLPPGTLAILHDAVRANFVVLAAEHYFDHEIPAKDRSRYGASAGFYNLPGSCLTAADYLHALRVGELARAAIDEVLGDADMIVTPTTPVTRSSTAREPKSHRRGGNAAFTSPFNISGHAALSFPVGVSGEGMPIGMQVVGRHDGELKLLTAGRALSHAFELPAFPDLRNLADRAAPA